MAEKRLQISKDLSLSLESVTNTEFIVARRRVGKTYTGSVYAEELMKAGQPFCVLDPTGAWWGLGSSADGKREGYPIIVIGGPHGHLPLEVGAGKIIANMITDNPSFYVIDFSDMDDENDVHVFAATFGRQLLKRQKRKPNPLKLIIDEADMFVPQKPINKAHITCFRAYDVIVRRGGINGLGVMLISQRPALINTDVRTQCETLIALAITAPHDQDPVLDWVSRNGTKDQLEQIKSTLASLGRGKAWYFSPNDDIFQLVQIRERETFNSSATPKPGMKPIEPKVFSKIDLDKLGEEIKNTVERTKLEDPDYLRRLNADLQRKITELETVRARRLSELPAAAAPKIKIVEKPVITKTQEKLIRDLMARIAFIPAEVEALNVRVEKLVNYPADLIKSLDFLNSVIDMVKGFDRIPSIADAPAPAPSRIVLTPKSEIPRMEPVRTVYETGDDVKLNNPQQRIIDAIAWMESIGLTAPKKSIIAFLADQQGVPEGYVKNLLGLSKADMIRDNKGESLELTDAGRARANQPDQVITQEELQSRIMSRLGTQKANILKVLIDAFPEPVSIAALGEQTGQDKTPAGYSKNLTTLQTFGIITKNKDFATALPILFLK